MSNSSDVATPNKGATFETISLDLLDDPKNPMRTDLTPESVADLVVSIRQFGIIEPLVVLKRGKRYEVVAGHRRLTAATILKMIQAPCYVISVSEEEAEFVKIHENLYRAEVAPSDQAEHFATLMKVHKLTPSKIAKLIGKSESYVSDRLQILSYPEPLREALDLKQIKFSVAKELYRVKDLVKLSELLRYATTKEISSGLAKQWVDDIIREQQRLVDTGLETPQNSEEYNYPEQMTQCVYCAETLKLGSAEIVYIHPECLNKVNTN